MGTLDETIKNLADAIEHLDAMLVSIVTWNDALHYLKEYRMQLDDIVAKQKTLEEKISHYCDLIKIETDHYARSKVRWAEEYKNIKDSYEALQAFWEEQQANPPITWEELKTMEGKPVWLEVKGYNGCWTIVHWNSNIVFVEFYDWIASPDDFMKAPLVSLDDTNFGTTWQAYRKERK